MPIDEKKLLEDLRDVIRNRETDELHLKPLPKEEQVPGEPDLVAIGEPSLDDPRQKVKYYSILLEYDFEGRKVPEGWSQIGDTSRYTRKLKLTAKRLPASKRGKFIKHLAMILEDFGIIDHDGQFFANLDINEQQILDMYDRVEVINSLASMVLDIDESILLHADCLSSIEWFFSFLANEENYIVDVLSFLTLRGKRS